MQSPIGFEILDGYACYRPSGQVTFNEAVAIISRAITQACDDGIKRLLIDTVNLRGFPCPTTTERYYMAEQWASHSRGLRLCLIARAEVIDPMRFGIMVARNRGLFSNVFDNEAEAVAWIQHPSPA